MSILANRLKLMREKHDISQMKLAKELGISNVQLSRYESGDRKPDPETIIAIADYFDVSVDYLLGRTDFLKKEERELGSLKELQDIMEKSNIDSVFFYDMEAWENFNEEDLAEIKKHFEWVAHKARERNEGEK